MFVLLPSLRWLLCSDWKSCVCVNCAEGPSAETKTVIVRNLSYDTTEESLKLLFDEAVNCRLMTHADSGKSKGLVVFIQLFVWRFLIFQNVSGEYGQWWHIVIPVRYSVEISKLSPYCPCDFHCADCLWENCSIPQHWKLRQNYSSLLLSNLLSWLITFVKGNTEL